MVAQEDWLTASQVANRLQLTADTIRRWCQSGKMRATFLSRRAGYRIPASEVERVLRGEPVSSGPEPDTEA